MADFAAPLPLAVLCDWLDLPADLREQVGPWTHEVRFLLEPGLMSAADFTRVADVVETFAAALAELIAARRARPGDDLISRLAGAATGGGDRLSDEETAFVAIMCFVAGHETKSRWSATACSPCSGTPSRSSGCAPGPTWCAAWSARPCATTARCS